MLKKEKKERVVLAKEHPLPKERMVSTIFDPRKLCIINAQRQPGKERGGGGIMENNGDVKTALSHQLASPPSTIDESVLFNQTHAATSLSRVTQERTTRCNEDRKK